MRNKVFKLRIALWLIVFAIIGLFLYWAVVPSGHIKYSYDFDRESKFIKKLSPRERVEEPKEGTQKIIGDPVYFALYTPRTFGKAEVTLKYKNPSHKFIEAGILVDNKVWRYDLKPVENNVLESIFLAWNNLRQNDVVLSQRSDMDDSKKYKSIDEFLNNLPEAEKIAIYNYDLKYEYLIEDYIASEKGKILNKAIRGPHQFFTYIKNEELNFKFSFVDLNKNKDMDTVDVYLYYNDVLLESRHLDDDGVNLDTEEESEVRELDFVSKNLPEGVYKLEIKANDDIVTKKIETKQSKISFLNKIWFYDDENENLEIVTDSRDLKAKTISPASLQKITVGESELGIDETYKQFSMNLNGNIPFVISLERDGLILEGDGVFSLNKDLFFNPLIQKVTKNFNANKMGVDYVLARYSSPEEDGEWKIKKLEFDLKNAYREKNKYSFLISVPGISEGEFVEIDEIGIELEGRTLIEKLKN